MQTKRLLLDMHRRAKTAKAASNLRRQVDQNVSTICQVPAALHGDIHAGERPVIGAGSIFELSVCLVVV